MKLRKMIAMAAVIIVFSLAVLAHTGNFFTRNIVEHSKVQNLEPPKQPTPTPSAESDVVSETNQDSVKVIDKIKSSIKEKDTSWKQIGESKYNGKSQKVNWLEWRLGKKDVRVMINEYDSEEKAQERIGSMANPSPFDVQIPIRLKPQSGFGDEAYIRDVNQIHLLTHLVVRSGNYIIILDGEKEHIFHFAKRILTEINSK